MYYARISGVCCVTKLCLHWILFIIFGVNLRTMFYWSGLSGTVVLCDLNAKCAGALLSIVEHYVPGNMSPNIGGL